MGAHGKDICAFEDGGVPRLDIPSYTWCTETNTGVSTVCLEEGKCATTFPSPAALAASFNRSLWAAKGATQSTEQRALFNLGAVRDDAMGSPIGLNGWGPNINTVRDPKYGRNSELPSEDPTLVRHKRILLMITAAACCLLARLRLPPPLPSPPLPSPPPPPPPLPVRALFATAPAGFAGTTPAVRTAAAAALLPQLAGTSTRLDVSPLPDDRCPQNGEYAVEVVRGMQEGDDPKWPLKIHATLKQCGSSQSHTHTHPNTHTPTPHTRTPAHPLDPDAGAVVQPQLHRVLG